MSKIILIRDIARGLSNLDLIILSTRLHARFIYIIRRLKALSLENLNLNDSIQSINTLSHRAKLLRGLEEMRYRGYRSRRRVEIKATG